jgi:hypothetical protein
MGGASFTFGPRNATSAQSLVKKTRDTRLERSIYGRKTEGKIKLYTSRKRLSGKYLVSIKSPMSSQRIVAARIHRILTTQDQVRIRSKAIAATIKDSSATRLGTVDARNNEYNKGSFHVSGK